MDNKQFAIAQHIMLDIDTQPGMEYAKAPPPKRTLMQIVDDYMAELLDSEGEVTLKLDELDGEIDDKALAYKRVGEILKGKAKAQAAEKLHYKEMCEKLGKREDAILAEVERLKTRLGEAMDLTKKTHIQTVYGKIYFKATKSAKLAEGWAEKFAATFPQYVKTTYEAKKKLLMADFDEALKHFSAIMPAEEAEAQALAQMPEGFAVEKKRGLYGI